jgi:transcriptional regulator with XRE-family HTH domain
MAEQPALGFAGLLRQLRAEAGLTQEELAQAAGLSPRSVSDLERGINRTARKDTAVLLGGALGLAEPVRALFVAAARGQVPAAEVLGAMRSARPRVWNIPARNPGFTGRDDLLAEVREQLLAGDKAVVQALQGMGGVGKTQLAAEYAHRFAGTYDMAWWINAEQGGLIGDQVAALGLALECVQPGAGTEAVRAAVLAELRHRGRWLLVFDNAEDPADVAPWLPGGGGHVLVTSRRRGWDEVAAPVEVDVLARAESVAILLTRVTMLSGADADRLAAELGDLPLAIAQAAGFMADTGMTADEFLALLRTRAGQLLAQGTPGSYPRSLAAATGLIADRLARQDPAAAELASVCAFLAPEPIPESLFTAAVSVLPSELAARAADPLAWRQTLSHVTRQSLARIDHRGLQMHRLTQAILRERLTPAQAAATRGYAEALLAVSDPGDPPNPVTWPRWARLTPHVLAADLAATANPAVRELARHTCWYLIERGDARTAHDLVNGLHQQWRSRLGEDDEHTLTAAHYLAWTLLEMGRYAESRDLNRDTLTRRRRVLGQDHPDTLYSAHNLAISLRKLGEVQAARDLNQDTLDRHRRVLGHDHSSTLRSAAILATDLRELGEVQAARDLDQDTLDRRRRVLGHDHPDTLASATSLATDLRELGEVQAARDLDQDTLDRRRRVLGHDHPDTLASATSLATDLRELGEVQAARDLDQDTLDRRRRVLGHDHPDTLASAANLVTDLRALGEGDDGP